MKLALPEVCERIVVAVDSPDSLSAAVTVSSPSSAKAFSESTGGEAAGDITAGEATGDNSAVDITAKTTGDNTAGGIAKDTGDNAITEVDYRDRILNEICGVSPSTVTHIPPHQSAPSSRAKRIDFDSSVMRNVQSLLSNNSKIVQKRLLLLLYLEPLWFPHRQFLRPLRRQQQLLFLQNLLLVYDVCG